MADEELREAVRRWRADESDQAALTAYVEALYRASLPVGHELLERRIHPPTRVDLATSGLRAAWVVDDNGELVGGNASASSSEREFPAHRLLWMRPNRLDDPTPVLLQAHGLMLSMKDMVSRKEALVDQLQRLPCTHLELVEAPWSTLGLAVHLPRLASLWFTAAGASAPGEPEDLAPLARSRHLSRIVLSGRLHPPGLATLAQPQLSELQLDEGEGAEPRDVHEVDGELEALARSAPNLQRLAIGPSRPCTDAGLVAIGSGLRRLKALKLSPSNQMTDVGVRALAGLPLEGIELSSECFTGEAVGIFCDLPLKQLDCAGLPLSPGHLGRLPLTLRELSLSLPQGSGRLEWLARLIHLESLTLFLARDTTDSDLAPLQGLEALTELMVCSGVPDGRASSGLVVHLRGCRRLSRLSLWELPELGPEAARVLRELPLRHLHVIGHRPSGPTDQAVALLAGHPTIERLVLESCERLTEACLSSLASMTSLALLRIEHCPRIKEGALHQLAATSRFDVYHDYELVPRGPMCQPDS